MSETKRWAPLAEGCIRDNILYTRLDGSQFYREWTPFLGEATHRKAPKMAQDCQLLGGGWSLPADPSVAITLISYDKFRPAMDPEVADGKEGGWMWTAQVDASDSGYAFYVGLSSGGVDCYGRDYSGLVRACREVSARQ